MHLLEQVRKSYSSKNFFNIFITRVFLDKEKKLNISKFLTFWKCDWWWIFFRSLFIHCFSSLYNWFDISGNDDWEQAERKHCSSFYLNKTNNNKRCRRCFVGRRKKKFNVKFPSIFWVLANSNKICELGRLTTINGTCSLFDLFV